MFTKRIALSELYCSLKVTIRIMHIAINLSHPSPSSVTEPEDPTHPRDGTDRCVPSNEFSGGQTHSHEL